MEEPGITGRSVYNSNWILWIIPFLLSLIGIVMIASLTSKSSVEGGRLYRLAFRQCTYLVLGLFLMFCCYLTPLSLIRRWSWLLWFLAVTLTFATLIPGIGIRIGGARRWLNLGFIQFQPLEILTLAIPLFLSDRLAASRRVGFEAFCRPTLLLAVLSTIPLYLQPNMGGIILVFALCMWMHVLDRGWKYPLAGAFVLSILFTLMILAQPYRMRRYMAFVDPWDDPLGKGFQIIQGLVAFSNGGVMGVGVGKGLQKLNYLPAAYTDYIFPAVGEEFGLAGTLFVVLLYAAWTIRAWMLFRRCEDPWISLLIGGLTVSVLFPMFINLGGVMKLMPLTGIPLPFVSLGGSALVFMWVKIGVLMRVGKELDLTLINADRERARP